MKLKLFTMLALILSLAGGVFAQRSLTGTVTDAESNEPLIGASVAVPGTAVGAVTDISGGFSLRLPDGATNLTVSYTGYETQTVAIGSGQTLNIALRTNAQLDEVVVTGYATERKKDLLGAVAVLDVKSVKNLANPNVLQSMQGRVAGVNVTTDGVPGQGVSMKIRGTSTLGKLSDPLYIVDGVPVQSYVTNDNNSTIALTTDLSWLNPSDIASVQVLKDASSASIYGARAANGVVIITTKQPTKNKSHVEFNIRTSMERWNKFDDLTNSEERAKIEWQGAVNDGADPDATGIYKYKWHKDGTTGGIQGTGVPVLDEIIYPEWLDQADQLRPAGHPNSRYGGSLAEGTDYWKEISRTGIMQNYDLSMSQGGSRGGVHFSANYMNHKGVVIGTGFKRMGLRLNSHMDFLNGRITVGQNLATSRGARQLMDNGFGGTPENAPYRYKSVLPVRTEDGRFSGPPGGGFSDRDNPVALAEDNKDDRNYAVKIFGNVYADVKLLKGLTFRTSYGGDYDNNFSKDIFHTYKRGFLANTTAELDIRQTHQTNWIFNNMLTYSTHFGQSNITLLGGTEAIKKKLNIFNAQAKGFSLETPDYMQLSAASGERTSSGFSTGFTLFSYFGKINYDLMDKYLASFTVRRDGSSRFGTQNRFAIFPAFSLGWRLSEEGFLRDNPNISNLKLRFAWGQTGNQDILDNARFGLYQAVYAPSSNILPWDGGCAQTPCPDAATSYDIGNNDSGILPSGFLATQTGNDALKWETTTEANFGLDLGLFDDRINLTAEVYQRTTKDILVRPKTIAAVGDGSSQWVNGADMETKGWETGITYYSPTTRELRYNVTLMASHYNSIITKLPESLIATYPGNEEQNIIGHAPNAFFGYNTSGIFQNQAEVDAHADQPGKRIGALRFVDANGDGKITALDQKYGAASNVPKVELGANFGANWKNWDASVFLFANLGRKVAPDVYRMELGSLDNGENGGVNQLDAWSPTNTGSFIPAASNTNRPYGFSLDYNVRNGAFLAFKQVLVGYSFPKMSGSRSFSSLRVYASGENLGYVVDRKGPNQYVQSGWSVENRLAGIYPKPQRFTVGISAGF